MEFQKLIETRRTVRKYAADSKVTREQMEALIRAAQEAPSWKNSQTGRYYCVLSREIVDKIRATSLPGAGNAGKSENAALIVTTFVSTLIMGIRESDKLRELLDIPETETVVSVIAVGKAAESPARPPRKELDTIAKFF